MNPRLRIKRLLHGVVAGGLSLTMWGCQHAAQEAGAPQATSPADQAIQRGLDYLAREVPLWRPENGCFSCHHNGDGARVLYQVKDQWPEWKMASNALIETTEWLRNPPGWDDNQGEPGFSDKGLARIQFALTLIEAWKVGEISEDQLMSRGVSVLVQEQGSDGSWVIEPAAALGSPATYGTHLATALARRALFKLDLPTESVRQAEFCAREWLVKTPVKNHLEAAAVLLGLVSSPYPAELPGEMEQRQRCLEILRQGQSSAGGWGPYPDAPPEPFDTAVVLLALNETGQIDASKTAIDRGRKFLLDSQWPEGDWAETTRPAGGESYAQRVSTTAWVVQALTAQTP